MIYNWNQTDDLKRTHEILQGDKIIATAVTPQMFSGELNFNGVTYFIQYYEDGTFVVIKDEKVIGYIAEKSQETGRKFLCFNLSYKYHEIKVNNSISTVYHICFGRKGNYYQFNSNSKTVGIISKKTKVINHIDKYTHYIKDENMQLMLLLFLEVSRYYNFMVAGEGNVVKSNSVYSLKEVREKYDTAFIDEVIGKDKSKE